MSQFDFLKVIGADANNLRDIDCHFPLLGMTAIVGVSGSGKSSLLHDVIAAETVRRNKLFHGIQNRKKEEPLVRAFVGAAPAMLYVGQRPFRSSSRTTIGTATGILGDIRQLFLSEGKPVTETELSVPAPSPESYAEWLAAQYRGKATIWTVPVRWVKSDGKQAAASLVAAGIHTGILRSETDNPEIHKEGRRVDLINWQPLPENQLYSLEAEVGSVDINGPKDRLSAEKLLTKAWDISDDDVIVELHDAKDGLAAGAMGNQLDGGKHYVHPDYRTLFRSPDLHLLSFNAPEHNDSGACPKCKGIGWLLDIDHDRLIPSPDKGMHDGAIALWTPKNYKHLNIQHELIEGLRGRCGFSPEIRWRDLEQSARDMILNGTGEDLIQGLDLRTGKKQGAPRKFEGFRQAILRRAETPGGAAKLAHFVTEGPCPVCSGSRWSVPAAALQAAGQRLPQWLALPMNQLAVACKDAAGRALTSGGRQALDRLANRAKMLSSLGLGHLSAERGMLTVSDGESRRLQIGAVMAASAGRLLLLLDEPARGLHEKDLGPMVSILKELSQRHCVLLNEHRRQIVAAADQVLTLGPGAGPDGGYIISSVNNPTDSDVPLNAGSDVGTRGWLNIKGASIHNILDQDVNLPKGSLTAIVGVSGSGKSSFARGILIPALAALHPSSGDTQSLEDSLKGSWASFAGHNGIQKLHVLHQRVPPRNRRSLVGTMTGCMDILAKSFAGTKASQKASLRAKDYSLNGGSGRCPVCLGIGTSEQNEHAPCPGCGGLRYGVAALVSRVGGLTISETLNLAVSDLRRAWEKSDSGELLKSIGPLLATMEELGLGHVALGRRVDSLSGGEIQRVRVAQILAGADTLEGHFFFLDEPAAGLHRQDSDRLMHVLRRMVDKGRNTVVIVEHNLDVLRAVDWMVEFGPGAGPSGGIVIAKGPPATLASMDTPTGQALKNGSFAPAKQTSMLGQLPVREEKTTLDHIVSGDVDGDIEKQPALKESMLTNRRLWEIGDLNLEVGKLLLDGCDKHVADKSAEFLKTWRKLPGCKLTIIPALVEMRIWGSTLPHSSAKTLLNRVKQMGLTLRATADFSISTISESPDLLRADLEVPDQTEPLRKAALTYSLAIGGGFVELTNAKDEVQATLSTIPHDITNGLITSSVLTLEQLDRHRPEGSCPACKGQGSISATALKLVVQSSNIVSLENPEDILTPEALALLKGIWRSEARPFFRRMDEEGLNDPDRLHDYLLYGFWHRPGHGTFLKKPKDDPNEVGSWLRWDGLFPHLWRELSRSKNKEWVSSVERNQYPINCPTCDGSGHGITAQLLKLQGRSFAAWATNGTVPELRKALEDFPVPRHRQGATRSRILDCLPLDGKLNAPAAEYPDTVTIVYNTFVAGNSV